MAFARWREIVRLTRFVFLIPLLAVVNGCSDIPIGSDTPGPSSGSGGGAGGGADVCQPGTTAPCYSGPMGTEGVGACAPGARTCNGDGTAYGPCVGETLPKAETCDAEMADDDCDGAANEEGPDCVCGDGYLSPGIGEECDDNNLDSTDACDASCKLWACGDGIVQPWEGCDDGNTLGGDACPKTCVFSVKKVSAGEGHTCAILDDDRLKCWGDNNLGQLGLGDPNSRGGNPDEMGIHLPAVDLGAGAVAVAIAAGAHHTCAILQDGRVKCWGANADGQLGLGDVSWRGDELNEMGDNLPAVDLGAGKTAKALALGYSHTCALLNDGSVKCWGQNGWCQLGLGFAGMDDPFTLDPELPPRGDDPGEMGDTLPAVNLGEGMSAVAIAAGYGHTCALLQDGSVKCWGNDEYGQLGLGENVMHCSYPNPVPSVDLGSGMKAKGIAAGGFHTCAVLLDGSVKCWGWNEFGLLGLGDTENRGDDPDEIPDNLPPVALGAGKKVIAIQIRSRRNCAILSDKSVKCWGRNDYGALGLGDTENRGDVPDEMGDNLPSVQLGTGRAVIALATGPFHSCAVFFDHSLKCWGGNDRGQLGLEDYVDRGDNPGEMGDALPFVEP